MVDSQNLLRGVFVVDDGRELLGVMTPRVCVPGPGIRQACTQWSTSAPVYRPFHACTSVTFID